MGARSSSVKYTKVEALTDEGRDSLSPKGSSSPSYTRVEALTDDGLSPKSPSSRWYSSVALKEARHRASLQPTSSSQRGSTLQRSNTLQRLRNSAMAGSMRVPSIRSVMSVRSVGSTASRRTVVDLPDQREVERLVATQATKTNQRQGRTGSILDEGDTVECEASRPDWGRDLLVMSPQPDSDGKHGKFYSQRLHSVGFWSLQGNALQLTWGAKGKLGAAADGDADILLATDDERHFLNEQLDMRLRVTRPRRSPDWFRPDVVSHRLQADLSPSLNFECPCCNFDLYVSPVCVVRSNSKRVCAHYMHVRCGTAIIQQATRCGQQAHCPTCFSAFNEVKALPDLGSEARDWYSIVDADHSGSLGQDEIMDAIGAVLPANKHKLQKWMRSRWALWDPNGDGSISLDEFMVPRTGLRDCILGNISSFRFDSRSQKLPPRPDEHPEKWFRFFDKNGNGLLDQNELLRGLVRTYCNDNNIPDLDKAREMRGIGRSLWIGLNYTPYESINFVEFSRPFGLMDQFIHNLTQLQLFGDDIEHVLTAAEIKHFLT